MNIDGVTVVKNEDYAVCYVHDLSDELKNIIRSQLSAICYGSAKAASVRKNYNYQNTLKEFIARYESKTMDTKIGMTGELLTHLLITQCFNQLNTVSPYFNLEEKSIKKGFDVVLYSEQDRKIWITEVKSGQLHQNKTASESNRDLLNTAKRDLKYRLNQPEVDFWENAINGAKIALEHKTDLKDAVEEILGDISDNIRDNQFQSNDKNVILVGALFAPLLDSTRIEDVEKFFCALKKENVFKEVIAFSIQKGTYEKIYDFLRREAGL